MRKRLAAKRTVVFDGDDTLWATQELYDKAKASFFQLLTQFGHDEATVTKRFAEIDVANVARLGFSRERFPLSMRETYEFFSRMAGHQLDVRVATQVMELGAAVFDAVPDVRSDAKVALETLRADYRLVLFTAGDVGVQRRRVEQTGLSHLFDSIRITPLKSVETWGELLEVEALNAQDAWSVGNSARSDIIPALGLGLRCVLITSRTWEYEKSALPLNDERLWHATTLAEVAHVIRGQDSFRGGVPSDQLRQRLEALRSRLEHVFALDTASPGTVSRIPSAGHCAAVAIIVQQRLGGELVSARVSGESHWFNRLRDGVRFVDVDLTGDQFGLPPIQVADAGDLYESAIVRAYSQLLPETLQRASRLAARADLYEPATPGALRN